MSWLGSKNVFERKGSKMTGLESLSDAILHSSCTHETIIICPKHRINMKICECHIRNFANVAPEYEEYNPKLKERKK